MELSGAGHWSKEKEDEEQAMEEKLAREELEEWIQGPARPVCEGSALPKWEGDPSKLTGVLSILKGLLFKARKAHCKGSLWQLWKQYVTIATGILKCWVPTQDWQGFPSNTGT
eukprot:gene9710-biopygen1908